MIRKEQGREWDGGLRYSTECERDEGPVLKGWILRRVQAEVKRVA